MVKDSDKINCQLMQQVQMFSLSLIHYTNINSVLCLFLLLIPNSILNSILNFCFEIFMHQTILHTFIIWLSEKQTHTDIKCNMAYMMSRNQLITYSYLINLYLTNIYLTAKVIAFLRYWLLSNLWQHCNNKNLH